MPETTIDTILTAVFFGVPAAVTAFFTAWLFIYEFRKDS